MEQQNQQPQPPMSGNDDLAKTLSEGLQFEETPAPGEDTMPSIATSQPDDTSMLPPTMSTTPPADNPALPTPAKEDDKPDTKEPPAVEHPHAGKTKAGQGTHDTAKAGSSELEKLKNSALEELRPLVGKLKLPPEEKFDTLLLIIRSTDDQSLLDQAHAAAKDIEDETRRAQALLDVIKEIDYFSSKR